MDATALVLTRLRSSFRGTRRRTTRTLGLVVVMLTGSLAGTVAGAAAQTEAPTLRWHVETLDGLLAATPEGQAVQVDDMLFDRPVIETHRDSLAARASGRPADPAAPKGASDASAHVNLWTGGNVYYLFDSSVSAAHREHFLDAAAEWEAFADIRFVVRSTQANYITVKDEAGLSGGNSYVGMFGGNQLLNIGSESWTRTVLLHEIGHALGLVHEHQRSDRDSFVTILTANIQPGQETNLVLLPSSVNYGAYDFLSVMHYSRTAFSVDWATKNTIEPKAPYGQFLDEMGRQFDRPQSRLDRSVVASLYGPATPAADGVVSNTRDSGPGSLRSAIAYAFDRSASAAGTSTTVRFAIPAGDPNFDGSVARIRPTAVLSALGDGTHLDGASQTTFGGNTNTSGPEIVISGAKVVGDPQRPPGVVMRGANSSVRGVVVNDFNSNGIAILGPGATGNVIAGSYIGTDPSGSSSVPNALAGVILADGAHGNTVGGTTPAARNVISGNSSYGVYISDPGTDANLIRGNFIGTNGAGTAALPNAFSGVILVDGAQSNEVGSGSAGAGNVISGNTDSGVTITSQGANVVQGNFIGLDAAGSAAVANGRSGVSLFAGTRSNRIGGSAPGEGNVVAGNTNDGVTISGAGTELNLVQGNLIGTDRTGGAAVANGRSGVAVFGGATTNGIGGSSAGAGNTISGNAHSGVSISGTNTIANTVEGNAIGLRSDRTQPLGNVGAGVQIYAGASNNRVGGLTAGARNFLSGNGSSGVAISQAGTFGNRIIGNTIGQRPDGSGAANGSGVVVFSGATGNEVGGTDAGAGNLIAANSSHGISVQDAATTGNRIAGNSLSANSGLGINLSGGSQNPSWVTANDPSDADTGPNQLQNHPVLTSAVSGDSTVVRGSLNSAANTAFRIEVFASPLADPSGHGEGATFLGSTSVTTDGAGSSPPFTLTVPTAVPVGQAVTATATDPAGNTSEFSANVAVSEARPPMVGGATWYVDGTNTRTGSVGAVVRAYAVAAFTDLAYQMVLATSDCTTTVAVLNPTPRFAGSNGFIATTQGQVPIGTPPGVYTICFKTSTTANTATAPLTFTLQNGPVS